MDLAKATAVKVNHVSRKGRRIMLTQIQTKHTASARRTLALVMALIMLLCAQPMFNVSAAAVSKKGKINNNVSWTLYSNGKLVISGKGSTGENVEAYEGMSDGAELFFSLRNKIKTVEVKKGITNICEGMFASCNKITSITLPDTVTTIGDGAFGTCSKLTKINIPSKVTKIGERAFYGCKKLSKITLPKSLTKIGENAFQECNALQKIEVAKGSKNFVSVGGMLYNKAKTTIIKCPANTKTIKIPKGVKTISSGAFENCKNLKTLNLPNTVKTIGGNAFSGCTKLSKITIPSSVTSIGYGAFWNTAYTNNKKNIKNGAIYINKCLISFDSYAYGKSSYSIKNGTRLIADRAFDGNDILTKVVIPKSVKYIGNNAFDTLYNMKSITIPASVVSIGKNVFGYKLTTITVDSKNKNYSSSGGMLLNKKKTTLIYCPTGKKSATLPKTVTKIADNAFYSSHLTKITLPAALKTIGKSAFEQSSLKTITIPKNVTSIGERAFVYCQNLKEIKVDAKNKNYSSASGILYNKKKTTLIKVPSLVKKVTIPKTVTKIGAFAFEGSKITTITVPKSVKTIDKFAFYGCDKLKTVKIYNSKCKIFYNFQTIERGTIYGYKNSSAQEYAKRFSNKFVKL